MRPINYFISKLLGFSDSQSILLLQLSNAGCVRRHASSPNNRQHTVSSMCSFRTACVNWVNFMQLINLCAVCSFCSSCVCQIVDDRRTNLYGDSRNYSLLLLHISHLGAEYTKTQCKPKRPPSSSRHRFTQLIFFCRQSIGRSAVVVAVRINFRLNICAYIWGAFFPFPIMFLLLFSSCAIA